MFKAVEAGLCAQRGPAAWLRSGRFGAETGGGGMVGMGNAAETPSSSPSSDSSTPSFSSGLHHRYSKQLQASLRNSSRDPSCKEVPVYVMLPLDSVDMLHIASGRWALSASFAALKSAGVEGIMVDVWWGLVEKEAPGEYDWSGYAKLFHLLHFSGLKIQAVMSFHQCGSNVGDSCCIPLPDWVVAEIDKDPDIVYTDKSLSRNYEYISLACDMLPVLRGRSPVKVYADYMTSFRDYFKDLMGDVIVEIQVGMGPAGELRYPSYPEFAGQWRFPGVGEFQCFDKYMLASLKARADSIGNSDWGLDGPPGAGSYSDLPEETEFFKEDGAWSSPYGHFFLEWYSDVLVAHGERLLCAAQHVFENTGAHISGKVSGIHWQYGTASHAAELTAGYYNTDNRDGYIPLASMFGKYGATLTFTCIEMKDAEQPTDAESRPESLVAQVAAASKIAGISMSGENALLRFDEEGYDQIVKQSKLQFVKDSGHRARLHSFTYLRLCDDLFLPENWYAFASFVTRMRDRTDLDLSEEHL